ncbi:unnamed protein product [Gadus morhua 'NCC']
MLTVHAMGWNHHKAETLHKALSTRYTSKRAEEEAERLSQLQKDLQCSNAMAVQWIAEVKEWAESETPVTGLHVLQQSIEGLHLGLKQRNKPSTVRMTATSFAIVSEEITIGVKKRLHDQEMLKTRLEEELPILVLEMAQHCTWLQNLGVALKTELARYEDENGLHCLLARRLAEVEERHQMVLQRYKTALGPLASVLLDVCEEEECDPMGLVSPDTSEDEEDAREQAT